MRFVVLALCGLGCGRLNFDELGGGDDAGAGADTPENTPYNIAFVTSTSISLVPGGVAAADAECMARAQAAGLPGNYAALLSTSTLPGSLRLALARGWVRVDGRPFADTAADIDVSRIYHPLSIDETGSSVSLKAVATGSRFSGNFEHCSDYTAAGGLVTIGDSLSGALNFQTDNLRQCTFTYPIYCFGVGRNVALAPTPRGARVAFVSYLWTPGAGIADADALCQNEATAAGLPGTFLAWLATDTASAMSRFSPEPVWTRVDGVPLATSAAAFAAGDLLTSLSVRADGSSLERVVWTGAANPTSVGTMTCSNWTSNNMNTMALTGSSWHSTALSFTDGMFGCANGFSVYCLQQ